MEKVIETKKCKVCSISFDITDKDLEFYDKVSPTFEGKKYSIPSPTLCPDCRQQRRLAWRNENHLYKRKCDLTGKDIISTYSPDKPNKVYEQEERWSDKWDVMNYFLDFNFDKPFFEQFSNLLSKVPRPSIIAKNIENTKYGNNVANDKNCYLIFVTGGNENCYYGHFIGSCKECVDTLWCMICEHCYNCTKAEKCYKCSHSSNIISCSNSSYLLDCINTNYSTFCIGLRSKQFHFLNQKYSKKEYGEIIKKIETNDSFLEKTKKDFEKLKKDFPQSKQFLQFSPIIIS